MNVCKVKKQSRDLLCIFDEGGGVQSGDGALAVWKSHFESLRVLGGGSGEGGLKSSCHRVNTSNSLPESSEHRYEPVSREEISWAINVLVRKDVSPGINGVVMDMMGSERLFEVWVVLFEVCWQYGRVPSL